MVKMRRTHIEYTLSAWPSIATHERTFPDGSLVLSLPQTLTGWPAHANRMIFSAMLVLLRLVWCLVTGLFRSRAALQAEILVLLHQLNVLRRKSPKHLAFSNIDWLIFRWCLWFDAQRGQRIENSRARQHCQAAVGPGADLQDQEDHILMVFADSPTASKSRVGRRSNQAADTLR